MASLVVILDISNMPLCTFYLTLNIGQGPRFNSQYHHHKRERERESTREKNSRT